MHAAFVYNGIGDGRDVLTRLHAATKPQVLGLLLIWIGSFKKPAVTAMPSTPAEVQVDASQHP